MRSPGCTRRVASLMRMRAPARSSRPVVVITDPRIGAPGEMPERISPGVGGITCPGASAGKFSCRRPRRARMPDMSSSGPPVLPCPVCATAVPAGYHSPCPTCGLPAAGQSALVVARIGATLTELTRDRDALLATLRAAAPGTAPAPARAYPPAARGLPVAPPPTAPPVAGPPPTAPPVAVPPVAVPPPVRLPARRLSPQQVLLGLGALLLVAGAIAFVALAWTRLGLAFQAGVMLAVTAAACGVSAWAAHRGLRATEEALAAAGAALLAVDLGGAYAKGLLGVDGLPVRLWAAIGCGVLVLAGTGLGRLTRTTATWPLVTLLAAQPAPFLLMTPG